ncbi:hypothetical protein M404DRAFT_290089 [Pisolithus tinctorius Marx 270]|uniref:Uncharacterized protein n=1 Tax=Pisolithus tinctorius Marx 270 TaxID=870435 RepID=A0A0C3PN28_PISTI|nr:hypothetical protein M404DRAFT_290089 [Pisolithus tinctorius Marx 270]
MESLQRMPLGVSEVRPLVVFWSCTGLRKQRLFTAAFLPTSSIHTLPQSPPTDPAL